MTADKVIEEEAQRVADEAKVEPVLPALEDKDSGDYDTTAKRLKSFLERVERLEEEKAAIAEDIKEVFAEAKGVGFDVKTMRKIIRLRKMDTEKRREEEELLEMYKSAVGMG